MKKKKYIYIYIYLISMVLKTGTVKEPENVLITGFMVGPRSD